MKPIKLNFLNVSIILIVLSCVTSISILAETRKFDIGQISAKTYNVAETNSKISIDGLLNEKAWREADIIQLPYEHFPGNNIPAPVKTECYITFSKTKLYIAFRCFDPEPSKIRQHYMERDDVSGIVQDDFICVTIDTFNDERRGFEFVVNSLGVQADAIFNELDGDQDFTWDALWESSGKITDFGYVVEMAIPFSQLRFSNSQKGKKQTWGFSIERSYPRSVNHIMISHKRNKNITCLLCQANKITGFQDLSPSGNFEINPTLTMDRTDREGEIPGGGIEKGKINANPGLNLRWGMTSNSSINTTVNPDFSQVEADVAQLEVNTRFALRYPEKRYFFLEGKDFFYSPLDVVFTRTVYNPLWGAKLTGKFGKNALGIFLTQDQYNNLLFPSNQGSQQLSLKENVYSSVVRYRRDVFKGSTLGFIYTGRISNNYYNHIIGGDGFLRLSKSKDINFQFIRSFSKYSTDTSIDFDQPTNRFSGHAIYARIKHMGKNLHYEAGYENLSPNFRADYGFIPRVDFKRFSALFEPIIWGKKADWFDRLSLILQGETISNQSGKLTDRNLHFSVKYDGPLRIVIQPQYTISKLKFNGTDFDLNSFESSFRIRPFGPLTINLFSKIGNIIDYVNSRKANSLIVDYGFNWRISSHISMYTNHIFERATFENKHLFSAHLLQTRLGYYFNLKTFIRAIIQYTDINRNTDIYLMPIEERNKKFFCQFLFSYEVNPQTVLYLGYSDNYLGENENPLTRRGRTFFLKIGYALAL